MYLHFFGTDVIGIAPTVADSSANMPAMREGRQRQAGGKESGISSRDVADLVEEPVSEEDDMPEDEVRAPQ